MSEAVTSAAAVAAILISLAALLIAFFQLQEARRLREDSKESAQYAKRSSDAALVSAATAQTALEIGHRAFLSPVDVRASESFQPNEPLEFQLYIKNAGNTPATNIRLYSSFSLTDSKLEQLT